MESNISRDHIALEAMATILSKSIEVKRNRFRDYDDWNLPDPEGLAETAYDYADAMIAERERRNQQHEVNQCSVK